MIKNLFKNEGFLFIVKFLCLFTLFYYFNLFFISITSKNSNAFYIFLKQNLDYIDWLRYSILHSSEAFCRLIGVKCHVENVFIIKLNEINRGLRMVYQCVGYGIMSFWAAFVIANKATIYKKVFWLVSGWGVIWIVNCLRVTVLLIALRDNWPLNKYIDHHTFFNIVAYGFIFLLMYIFIRFDTPTNKLSN